MIAHLCNRIWMSSRDFIAIAKSASADIKKTLEEGKDLSFLEVENIHGDIRKVIQFLQQPQVNIDAWTICEKVLDLFEKRTGLSELLYGMQQMQSRSATDVKIREQMVSIRPDRMAAQVETWMAEVAKAELFGGRWLVQGRDVEQLLGKTGAYFWDQLIVNQPVERTIYEIDYGIQAGSGVRRNKARDIDNVQQAVQMFGPILDGHANATGDTGPINGLIRQWGKAADFPVEELEMGERVPEGAQDQQAQQQQLQMQQAQMEQAQQQQQAQQQMEQEALQAEQQRKSEEHGQEMQQDQEKHVQELVQQRQMGQLKLALAQAQAKQQAVAARQKAKATPKPSTNGVRK